MSKYRVPALGSSNNIIIRLTEDKGEIEGANRLIFGNYVSAKYWENDAKNLQNEFLHTAARKVIVALENKRLVGTISLLVDSPIGLPSESAQAALIRDLRAKEGRLAEVSGFAMNRARTANTRLALFLMSYVLRCAYYQEAVDRVVASCIASHARFYESALGFSRLSGPTRYRDSQAAPGFYLLGLELGGLHSTFIADDFRRFIFHDSHPSQRFPLGQDAKSVRNTELRRRLLS